jgi:hypothetical protein
MMAQIPMTFGLTRLRLGEHYGNYFFWFGISCGPPITFASYAISLQSA